MMLIRADDANLLTIDASGQADGGKKGDDERLGDDSSRLRVSETMC